MTASQPKPKLTLTTGSPVTIALQNPAGVQVKSLIPGAQDQIHYRLTDGRSMYVPVEVGTMIDRLNLRAGQSFTLVKRGPRDWDAQTVEHTSGPVNASGEDAAAILGRCYQSAISIAVQAVEVAKEAGLMICPTFEDVRAIAATMMISETRPR